MSTRYEYVNIGADYYSQVAGDVWWCQTFTPLITHYITLVKLFLFTDYGGYVEPEPSSDVVLGIQNTTGNDNHPDGTDLTSATFDREELTTDASSEWKESELLKYRVIKGTTYAIVLRMPDAVTGEVVNWWYSEDDYARGSYGVSDDGGVTWVMEAIIAPFLFEEWGDRVGAHHHPTIPTEPNRGKVLSRMGSL